jgi:hypothetical protein
MMAESYAAVVDAARVDTDDLLLVERDGAHAIVTLNDPDKLNPMSAGLTVRLRETLTDLARTSRYGQWCSPAPTRHSRRAAISGECETRRNRCSPDRAALPRSGAGFVWSSAGSHD